MPMLLSNLLLIGTELAVEMPMSLHTKFEGNILSHSRDMSDQSFFFSSLFFLHFALFSNSAIKYERIL